MAKQLDDRTLVDFTRRWFAQDRSRSAGADRTYRRVTRAYEMFIEPGEYTFEATGDGYDVLVLDDDGRILLDHQHIL